MRVKYGWLGLGVVVAGLAAFGACSGEEISTLINPCDDVVCANGNEYVDCDPTDAICKCGPFDLNLVCGPDEVCTPQGENAFACVNTKCELVTCKAGETCNPATGECACGTGPDARKCEDNQTCENGRCSPGVCDGVECTLGSTCDPDDGSCKCAGVACDEGVVCVNGECNGAIDACELYPPDCRPGESCDKGACTCGGGAGCGVDQRCTDGSCVADPCAGVNCPFGTTCNPDDSLCHCGTDDANGPVCAAGQACLPGSGNNAASCVSNSVCEKVSCAPGMVCDPNPDPGQGGFCRCGGIGPQYPRCDQNQTCDLSTAFPSCKGGDPCAGKDCAKDVPGSSCDPEDGKCKCGGLDGLECGGSGQTGYACSVEDKVNICTTTCNPLASTCTGEDACYFDPNKKISLCLAQGDTLPDRNCKLSQDCVAGAFCAQLQDSKVCRELCNLDPPAGEPNGCPDTKICSPLPNSPDPKLGQCLSFG